MESPASIRGCGIRIEMVLSCACVAWAGAVIVPTAAVLTATAATTSVITLVRLLVMLHLSSACRREERIHPYSDGRPPSVTEAGA